MRWLNARPPVRSIPLPVDFDLRLGQPVLEDPVTGRRVLLDLHDDGSVTWRFEGC